VNGAMQEDLTVVMPSEEEIRRIKEQLAKLRHAGN